MLLINDRHHHEIVPQVLLGLFDGLEDFVVERHQQDKGDQNLDQSVGPDKIDPKIIVSDGMNLINCFEVQLI